MQVPEERQLKSKEVPEWLQKTYEQSLIIQAFVKVFETDCNCEVCQMLRRGLKASEGFPPTTQIVK
jgi:hypothetical protein